MNGDPARREFFEARSQMMQAWEDLTAEGVPARLGMNRDGSFEIDAKGGEIGVIQRVCLRRGLVANAGAFGVTLKAKEE